MRCWLLLMIVSLLDASSSIGQACTNPGQTPASAFPVCGSSVFSQTTVPVCSGNILPAPCTFQLTDKNPYWYKFTCYQTGTLGFVITPNTITDDYDWQLFDITGAAPADVYTNSALFVCCNWSGETGATGASSAGSNTINCEGTGVPRFNVMPTLIANHNYLLMVSHFDDGSQSGYSLQFGGGTAVITDTLASDIVSATPSCDGLKVGVKLNKKLKCSSLAANGTDFSISAAGINITAAVGVNCSGGFDMDSIVLTLSAPLTAGAYTVQSKQGADGNTLLDYCNVPMPVARSTTFNFTPGQPSLMDSIAAPPCKPKEIVVVLNTPVLCSSVASNGSDFTITGPSIVTVSGATPLCVGGSTSQIKLQLTGPIFTGGTYQVAVKQGSDGNTLTNVCGLQTPAGDTKVFVAPDTVSAAFTYNITRSCGADTITFLGNPNAAPFGWNWLIDTSRYTSQQVVIVNTVTASHIAQLIVSNGTCSDTVRKTISVSPIPALKTTTSSVSTSCGRNDGSIKVVASGGLGTLTYLWNPGGYTTATVSNVATGKYFVTVTDSIGCQRVDSVTVNALATPSIDALVVTDVKCFNKKDGTITALVSGGQTPYTFQWTNGGGSTFSGNPLRNADTGKYTLLLTDGRGCTATLSATIIQPPQLKYTAVVSGAFCNNTDGSIILTTTGGTLPYSFKWLPRNDTTPNLTQAAAGNYSLRITDANGCIDSSTIAVPRVKGLSDSVSIQNSCRDINTGKATVFSFGTAPYRYRWQPIGDTTSIVKNLPAGNYTVFVTDKRNCADTVSVVIGNVLAVSTNLQINRPISCNGDKNGAFTLITNGLAPFTYKWQPAISTNNTVTGVQSGTYQVTIKDSAGCSTSQTVVFPQPDRLSLTVYTKNTSCGFSNGEGNAIVAGGTTPYRYQWTNGARQATVNNLSAGRYVCLVTDSAGCQIADSAIKIKDSQPLVVSLGPDIDLCPGDSILLTPGTYNAYLWQNGDSLPAIYANRAGTYSVKVWDADSCVATASVVVRPICNDLLFPDAFTPNGDGRNDLFGPLGTLLSLSDYKLIVYNRWGNTIFTTTNPNLKWNGMDKDKPAPAGTYVWMATYRFNGKASQVRKGTILLIK